MRFRLGEIAAAIGGVLHGADIDVTAVTIDSREVPERSLFVPIVAERDGHEFIAAAIEAGAVGYLTHAEAVTDTTHPHVVVDDTEAALGRLGRFARTKLPDPVIGVTGSVGKTTTKDLLASALGADRPTHASTRSFNNELGVPLTLANAPDNTMATVVEMGARGIGHIADLCGIAAPSIGVVIAVAAAHTELFGDLDGVAVAKAELVEALPPSGTAVLNRQDDRVYAMRSRTEASVLTFGDGGDVSASEITIGDDLRARFRLDTPSGHTTVRLAAAGQHVVVDACAAAAAALAAGVPVDLIATGLEAAAISPNRMAITEAASGCLIIDDSYNANPSSMHAAIDALLAAPGERRHAIVGRMAELGNLANDAHAEIGDRLRAAGVDAVAYQVAEYGLPVVETIEDAVEALGAVGPGDVVLVKASRVAGLERAAALLTD